MEKQTVFIKVSCIDRLPLVSGYYHTDEGISYYSDIFEDWSYNVEYWLEEIELPSEEEISKEVKDRNQFLKLGFIKCANFILNHLK